MKDISLHLLDIVQNAIAAGSTRISVDINETKDSIYVTVADDGVGIDKNILPCVSKPFYTTRPERDGGLGLWLFKQSAEMTGGTFDIRSRSQAQSKLFHGTIVYAEFVKNGNNALPLGDIVSTVCAILPGLGNADLRFIHTFCKGCAELNTAAMRRVIGKIPLSTPAVIKWARDELEYQYDQKE